VKLMLVGYRTGRITTVTAAEAARSSAGAGLRRWIYNRSRCGQCDGVVRSWPVNARTCYACESCQGKASGAARSEATTKTAKTAKRKKKTKHPSASKAVAKKEGVVFLSHCASEPLAERLRTPMKLRVAELKSALVALGVAQPRGKKALLVAQLVALRAASDKLLDLQEHTADLDLTRVNAEEEVHGYHDLSKLRRKRRGSSVEVKEEKKTPTLANGAKKCTKVKTAAKKSTVAAAQQERRSKRRRRR